MSDPITLKPGDKTLIIGERPAILLPYVVIIDGPRRGRRFHLQEGENLAGRAPGVHLLLDDQSVSRRHCELQRAGDRVSVRDLGSKNGTLVNGVPTPDAVVIGHGDLLQVGIYVLRLITHEVSETEELAPPESGTRDIEEQPAEPTADTSTVAQSEDAPEAGAADDEGEPPPPEAQPASTEPPPPSPPRRSRRLLAALALIALAVAGYFAYDAFLAEDDTPPTRMVRRRIPPPPVTDQVTTVPTTPPPVPTEIPVIVDFAANPFPAQVTFLDKNLGLTPVRTTANLKPGEAQTAEGRFEIPEFRESYVERVTFTVEAGQNLVPVYFRPPIGSMSVEKLPRDAELTLHAWFAYDPFNKRSATLAGVSYGKPLFLPYGRYEIELRCQKGIGVANQTVPTLCYRREVLLTPESPKLPIEITEETLNSFPIDIRSEPAGADILMDGRFVGTTPYAGQFPLGEHILVVRKEGYLEASQSLKTETNVPVQLDIPLKTTAAGGVLLEGRQLVLGGRYKEAVAKLSEVFTKSPSPIETAQANYHLATAFLGLGDFETSRGYYTQAQTHPEYELKAKLGLARIYFQQGQRNEALLALSEIMLRVQEGDPLRSEAQTAFKEFSPLRSVLYVRTDPPGATLFVNDNPMKDRTPALLPDLGLGNFRLRLELPDYLPQEVNINLTVHEFNPVIVKLQPVPK